MRNWIVFSLILGFFSLQASAEQQEKGLKTVLNGKDLSGLKTTGNWTYEADGSLALKPREGEKGWQRYDAYLWLEDEYADFVFDFEFKYNARGNSGFFFRVSDLKEPVKNGTEVQILDCYGKEKKLGHHDMGGIIRTTGPLKNACKPAGEWNRMVVTCKGMQLKVELNGELVQDYDLSQSKAKIPAKGYIGIQDHGQEFWVRNLKVKAL